MGAAVLRLEGVSYRYPGTDRDSLRDVTLELAAGSLTGLLGAAESGKSTLCLVLGGLAPRVVGGHLRGSLSIDGADVRDWPMHRVCESVAVGLGQPASQLSLVAATVYEEVAFGPANLGLPRDEVMARTQHALEQLDIDWLASRDPRRLSDGQQQLVAMAGLLAMRPRALVLDEPVAHLDGRATELVLAAIVAAAAKGTAVLVAGHAAGLVIRSCETALVMVEGRIVRRGPAADVLADPATWALGIEEPAELRLERLLAEAGAWRDPVAKWPSPAADQPPPTAMPPHRVAG